MKGEYVKLNQFHITSIVFEDFKESSKNLWKNQEFAISIIKSSTKPCSYSYISAIPIMFKDCINVKKGKINLAKYDRILVEEAIETNNFTKISSKHIFCKKYYKKENMYMAQLTREITSQMR
jgi:hypothetical protein